MSRLTKSMWLRRVGPLSLAGALVLPLALDGAETPAADGKNYQEVYEDNHKAMQALFDGVEKDRRAAVAKADAGEYLNAINALEALQKKVAPISGTAAAKMSSKLAGNLSDIKSAWSADLMQEAQDLYEANKLADAVAKAQQAHSLTPGRKYIDSFIAECQKHQEANTFRNETSLSTVSPEYKQRQSQIDMDLREAKLLFRNKRYESASKRLERVLMTDPFNMEAMDLLSHVYDRLYKAGINRTDESRRMVQARNVWEWSEPLERVQIDDVTNRPAKVRKEGGSELYNRLERIVFPSVPLKDSTLTQIISYLNEKSRAYDPNKEGVTIIDNLSPEDKQRKISFELGRMPLLDIIRYLGMASELSYSFRGDKVVFGVGDNMSTEYFPVRGEIIAEIIDSQIVRSTGSGMKGPEEGGGDLAPMDLPPMIGTAETGAGKAPGMGPGMGGPEGGMAGMGGPEGGMGMGPGMGDGSGALGSLGSTGVTPKQIAAALKSYFTERWITFENGANILYSPRGERLMVKNTPENLRRMDALLRQLDALEQPMIMVEAKLIELTDTNLNELGFEWAFAMSRTAGDGWSLGTTDPTRHGNGASNFRVLNNLKIFPNFGEKLFGSDTKVDLSLSINAVAQNQRAEVLASPRILSESGAEKPAKIQMTEKTYFITEWEEPDIETDGFSISVEGTDPDWDEEYDLGVTFSVQPTVQADNYTITLNNINPVFLTHVGDFHHVLTYEVGIVDAEGKRTPVSTYTYDLRMPEIARREMLANITLYDGETVLIGGMADNESTQRDDKWPLLGDIPFIGNLFRDQQSSVTNRTLLMFISARLVNPNGVPIRSQRDRALIEFNR